MGLIIFFHFLTFLGFPLLSLIFISNFLLKITPLQKELKKIKENLYSIQPKLIKNLALLQESPQLPNLVENLRRIVENSEELIKQNKLEARRNLQEAFSLTLQLQPYFKNTKYEAHLFQLQASLNDLMIGLEPVQ